ncbi:nuclease-related domain-containing protein [Fictibacillus fluitans]|uniref:Nuclease-related domain-containing protein n=1 Tax=Fictibacillus fluitans TaxID=3058422 RepID=A0ABT8HXU2_9BACL|nr:nuclease-related domain-containing protein [Fictibacillus sp. NE201]MDN4525601.1 nuclease-related domain-containing protein [Fictibacillus sp. NE201]
MIVKERKMPLILQKMEALLRRIPEHHPKRKEIEASFYKYMAGYRGEESLDYPLSFLHEKEYFILHDLRLWDGVRYFQMDTLIVSPAFILVLEVKNFTGTLVFDQEFSQLIRLSEEKEEAFPDPLLQVQRQEKQLNVWLENHRFEKIPIEALVIISSPYTLIKNPIKPQIGLNEKVLHTGKLMNKIDELKSRYTNHLITDKLIRKLIRQLQKEHTPLEVDVLQRFKIQPGEILKGVHCMDCGYLPMKRMSAKWICSQCLATSKNAHLIALHDYKLLLGESISNREFRHFLFVPSASVAQKLLCSMNLPVTGSFKNRKYFLHFPD